MHSTLVRAHQLAETHIQAAEHYQNVHFDDRVHGAQFYQGFEEWSYDAAPPSKVPSELHKEWNASYFVQEAPTDVTYRIHQPTVSGWSPVVRFKPAEM
ncbi:hypothetical protein P879_09199 [Paragonimus westermani]|uniref:Uncharacterized protein n=1 Tax=Paragonimus westermani TaxID=34504 RepID=A0A8T0D9Z6_9TREM|nr:hypothetical protein P879_09199 [Paragonimus westermani]